MKETLLTHEVTEIVLVPELIAQNKLVILQHDLMTGLNSKTEVDYSRPANVKQDINNYLSSLEFNFLSEIQQQSHFKGGLKPEHKKRMKEIVNDFLGK